MTAQTKKTAATGSTKTNTKKDSLVQTIVLENKGRWLLPSSGEKFYIDEDCQFPTIDFEIETDASGPFTWSWSIVWPAGVSGLRESPKRGRILKTYRETGTFQSESKKWRADLSGKVLGGVLSVTVKAGADLFKRSVFILGKNPGETKISEFLLTLDDVKGMEILLEQESKFKHFIEADGQPVVSFDAGYGLTQMTNPAPSYEQIWSWKENIKVGATLYRQKQREAKSYLSKSGRVFSDEQLKLETWTRWNGGTYHVWDQASQKWVRNPNWLCDTSTGNIGWNLTKADNKDQSEAALHKRDKDEYAKPPERSARKWDYTGVCYADHLNK